MLTDRGRTAIGTSGSHDHVSSVLLSCGVLLLILPVVAVLAGY